MAIAKILVPVRGDGRGQSVLDHALALARPFGAHIEVLYCQAQSEDMLPYGVVVPRAVASQIAETMTTVGQGERERMRGLFREAAERHALPVIEEDDAPIEAAGTRTTLSWREARGRQADLLGTHGRLADLIAVPRPDRAANLGFNTLYAALMSSGRPVLMCPAQAPTALPGRIALAWNGSMEASRAVAVGLALLRASAGVHILTVGETPEGTTPEALARYLAGHGVVSEIEVLAGSGDIGARLLARAKAAEADLLMMGAYSHSRGRESLFGGASQYVVDHADLPVFLVH